MQEPDSHHVLLLPGIVLPAELAYGDLITALEHGGARVVAKELEVYATEEPPEGYSLDLELDGALRTAEGSGFGRFHIVGYSGGGACAAALVARNPERVLSLALLEPAWLGNQGLSEGERAARRRLEEIRGGDPAEMMAQFVRLQLAPGVEPPEPPPGPAPDWMAKRPAGIDALVRAFDEYELDRDALRSFEGPVYYGLGGRSNPEYFARQAERAEAIFSDFTLEIFPERHHFEPPHRFEPERLARSLERLWARSRDGVAG